MTDNRIHVDVEIWHAGRVGWFLVTVHHLRTKTKCIFLINNLVSYLLYNYNCLFLQGTVGPRGPPGSRGPPGEGLPGPKVSAPNHNRDDNQANAMDVKINVMLSSFSGRPRVARRDGRPRRERGRRPRTQGKSKLTVLRFYNCH